MFIEFYGTFFMYVVYLLHLLWLLLKYLCNFKSVISLYYKKVFEIVIYIYIWSFVLKLVLYIVSNIFIVMTLIWIVKPSIDYGYLYKKLNNKKNIFNLLINFFPLKIFVFQNLLNDLWIVYNLKQKKFFRTISWLNLVVFVPIKNSHK